MHGEVANFVAFGEFVDAFNLFMLLLNTHEINN